MVKLKQGQAIATLGVSMFLLASGITYGIGFAMKLPLPGVKDGVYKPDYVQQDRLMQEWDNARIYQKAEPVVEADTSQQDFTNKFTELDTKTVTSYLDNNKDLIANGYGKLIIDKVDTNNTATGVKTTNGDDVLGLSVADNVMVVGLNVNGQKAKLGILKDKKQLGMSLVENMTYWEQIQTHATRENAILAINASDYTWNQTGNYGTLYGVAMRNGDLIRRVQNSDNVVGFDKDGKIQIGGSVDNLYNVCEGTQPLIKDGALASFSNSTKSAKTAIGQTADGTVLMLTVDGDDKSTGATYADLANILQKYGATNAAALSEGKCTTMWWNGRVVNKPSYADANGIKLPTTWVIRHSTGESK